LEAGSVLNTLALLAFVAFALFVLAIWLESGQKEHSLDRFFAQRLEYRLRRQRERRRSQAPRR